MDAVYNLPIHRIASLSDLTPSSFEVIDSKIEGRIVNLLLEYRSQKAPEIKALLDENNHKLYLVGGKIDEPVETVCNGMVCVTLAKANQAWVSVDLSTVNKAGELDIMKIEPAVFVKDPSSDSYIKIQEAHAAVLLSVTN